MMGQTLRVLRHGFPEHPAVDTAFSAAILEGVGSGSMGDTIRIYRPGRAVAFGRRDVHSAGYRSAVGAARASGFEAVERLAGGRAAVFHENTIAVSWARRASEPRAGIESRFVEVAEVIRKALRGMGFDARVGQIPGEYCPGRHSVNAAGRVKLFGSGQRIVSGAVHVGGVLVVDGAEEVVRVLDPVYRHLDFTWHPEATGDLASIRPDVRYEDVVEALLQSFASTYQLVEGILDDETVARAEELSDRFLSPHSDVLGDPFPSR